MKILIALAAFAGLSSCSTIPRYKEPRHCQQVETWMCDQFGTYCYKAVRTECVNETNFHHRNLYQQPHRTYR